MKNIIIVSYSVIAALIGAGFASGQEMLCYFVYLDKYGITGIIVTSLVFTAFIYTVLSYCIKNNPRDYDDFLCIFKNRYTKLAAKTVTLIFSLAVYGTMLSALGELINSIMNIPTGIASLFCAVITTVIFSFGTEKVFTFNGILGICLVFLITFCCLYMLSYREFHVFSPQYIRASGSGMIYSGYNLVSLTPVLVALAKRLKTRSDAAATALSAGVTSAVIMILIFCLLAIYAGKISLGTLPMLTLAKRQNPFFAGLYSFVLLAAIITTLFSSGGGLCDALKIKKRPLYIALLSAAAYLLSGLGFANLINTAYRLCGIGGFFVCSAIIVSCLRYEKKR